MKRQIHLLLLSGLLLILNVCSSLAQNAADYALRLQSGVQEMPENVQSFDRAAQVHAWEEIENNFYRFLQFYQLPTPAQHRAIEALGIELLNYIPNKTYIASIPTQITQAELENLGVRSILAIPDSYKLGPQLEASVLGAWAQKRNMLEVSIKFHANISATAIEDYCRADAIQILNFNGKNNFLTALIPEGEVQRITQLPYVSFIDLAPAPGEPEDTPGRGLHRANTIDTDFGAGRTYTGKGVSVLVRDDGFVGPHIDFHGRMTQDVEGDGGINHADGVAGIFAGAGNYNPAHRGMAAGSDIFVIDYQADFLDETMDLHLNAGVLVTNSSYSNGCNAGYTAITATVDQQVYQNPTLMHVFSAGNSNNNDCGYGAGDQWGNITGGHKQGKNVIATANLLADGTLVGSSSRGPAYDGRIKPDISANGAEQISTDPNNAYSPFGGTSAASPGIAGITAQLHEAYADLNGGETAPSALLKACLMNSANEMGNPGPDFRFGWGHVNALRAVQTLEENRYFSATVTQGGQNLHTLSIPAGVQYVKIMTYWADQEAVPDATLSLINDLDTHVEDNGGNVFQPWVLDPTPNPAALDAPATTGEDHLNNVEQVAIQNPPAGAYTLVVDGTTIPFGEHEYYVVYEFYFNAITLTYPFGGEGLAPGEEHYIHWDAAGDAQTFTIEYSTDGGMNWNPVGEVPGDERLYLWDIPEELSGNCHVRVSRNGISGQNEHPFSIMNIPDNLDFLQVCPDYVRIKWDPVDGATGYDVFMLGEKYMDSLDNTTNLFYDFPTLPGGPIQDHYFAVRATGDDNLRSRRSIAYYFNGDLFSCNLSVDVSLNSIITPNASNLFGCQEYVSDVEIVVLNGGQEPATSVEVGYQLNDLPAVTAVLPITLQPGEATTYVFDTPLTISDGGNYVFKTWTSILNDEAAFNDTSIVDIVSSIYPSTGEPLDYAEDFENGTPPVYWNIINPDAAYGWEEDQVIGINGNLTTAMKMDNYFYNGQGAEDRLVSVPIDLTDVTISSPVLTFDIAYAPYNLTQYYDGLRVEIFSDCGNVFEEVVYYKEADELGTVPASTSVFEPQSGGEWRTEAVSLNQFVGKAITINFINVSGYGNTLFLDNINVAEFAGPTASYSATMNEICEDGAVIFQSTSSGGNLQQNWAFTGAIPNVATGPGPHLITYPEAGNFPFTLTVTNAIGSSSTDGMIDVAGKPTPAYTYEVINGGIIQFTNASADATEYLWEFGDGNSSTEANPLHVYTESGDYEVVLTAINDCGGEKYVLTLSVVISSVEEVRDQLSLGLFPNPSTGRTQLQLEGLSSGQVEIQVVDVTGKQLLIQQFSVIGGSFSQALELSYLPKGLYLVKAQTEQGLAVRKLIIQ